MRFDKFLPLIALFLYCFLTFGHIKKTKTGLYFLSEDTNSCMNIIQGEKSKITYCITNKPIISTKGFTKVSEVYQGTKFSFFEISLTLSGQQTLKKLIAINTNLKLGLIHEGSLIGVLDTDNINQFDKVKIIDTSNSEYLQKTRINLQELLDNN